jgi:hypothetical protein
MTYGIVTAILVLALIAVVFAVVFVTDEEDALPLEVPSAPPDEFGITLGPRLTDEVTVTETEENQTRDRRIVDVPTEADRDTRTVGI